MKKSGLLFSECQKVEVEEPLSLEGLHSGLTNPESTDYAHWISCWADVKVSVEEFLKQFISQVEKMGCKSSKPCPL